MQKINIVKRSVRFLAEIIILWIFWFFYNIFVVLFIRFMKGKNKLSRKAGFQNPAARPREEFSFSTNFNFFLAYYDKNINRPKNGPKFQKDFRI